MKSISDKIGAVEHLPTKVAAYITRQIAVGTYQPGEQLPTEHKFADTLGVSRNVVREAISQLRADGIILARQGVGAFVQEPERRSAIRLDSEALKAEGSMQRLFELRSILETEAAGLAAERLSTEGLKRIGLALKRMSGEERWEDGSIEADLEFHREIARATNNDYIYTFVCFICEQIRRSIYIARDTNPLHELVEINVSEHERIFHALNARDATAAREAMRSHIFGAGERIGAIAADGASEW
ncbi:MAG: FadR/GntR family transcriptional regulator [Pseudomonadota bacterium]